MRRHDRSEEMPLSRSDMLTAVSVTAAGVSHWYESRSIIPRGSCAGKRDEASMRGLSGHQSLAGGMPYMENSFEFYRAT